MTKTSEPIISKGAAPPRDEQQADGADGQPGVRLPAWLDVQVLHLKRYMPKTLFGRAIAIIITPLIMMHAISTFVFYDRHWDTMTRRLANNLAGDIAMLVERLPRPVTEDAVAQLDSRAQRHLDIALSWRPGAVVAPGSDEWLWDRVVPKLADALNDLVRKPFAIDTQSIDRRVRIDVQLADGVLEVITHQKRLYSSTVYIFLMWMVGSSLVLFAVAIVFLRNQIRPIRRLAFAARRFGLGREVPAFRLEGASEVRQAAAAFQQMQERIRRQIGQRTAMLAGVSHDLRTPLTRMKLQLAMLRDSPDIRALRDDVTDMERMIEGYLAFARGEGTEVPVPSDLGSLIEDVVEAARRGGTRVELTRPQGAGPVIELRPQALKRALDNLVGNAKRYADRVQVTLKPTREAVDVLVDDDGTGIPAAMREEVFKAFFRLEASRNPETGGTGLGLTIARDIARGHGGDVTLEDSPLGGLRARLRLPV
jgi:two-component system, OmpR family, osmolarity sensor histidine kinase EnvZ